MSKINDLGGCTIIVRIKNKDVRKAPKKESVQYEKYRHGQNLNSVFIKICTPYAAEFIEDLGNIPNFVHISVQQNPEGCRASNGIHSSTLKTEAGLPSDPNGLLGVISQKRTIF
jgi:hypothetical protein